MAAIILGLLLALFSVVCLALGALSLFANAMGSVTAPGSASLLPTAILGLGSIGFGIASWFAFHG